MPTLLEAVQNKPDTDKLQPVSAAAKFVPVRTQTEEPGPGMFTFGPLPGASGTPDGLRQFYRTWLPQYRIIPPTTALGGKSENPAPAQTKKAETPAVAPPIPAPPGTNIFYNDEPVGVIDGANDTFTLTTSPNPPESLVLTKNGQILYPGVGYTLLGSTITYEAAYIPVVGDSHLAIQYLY